MFLWWPILRKNFTRKGFHLGFGRVSQKANRLPSRRVKNQMRLICKNCHISD